MQPGERDAALLADMLKACDDIVAITAGLQEKSFLADRIKCLAVERCLEIVGEAVRRTSAGLRAAHPEIAWQKIIGLRNILAHEYGHIEGSQIYKAAAQDVPALAHAVRRISPGVSDVREPARRYVVDRAKRSIPHLPRRQVIHDLARAAANRQHLGLAIQPLHLRPLQVTGSAQDLHRFSRHTLERLRRQVLQQR